MPLLKQTVGRLEEIGLASREWLLKRNCALSPRQLAIFYLSLVVVSLFVGLGFALVGAWPILPFCGLEMLALGAACLIYGRHATDHERVVLAGEELIVESVAAGQTTVVRLNPYGMSIDAERGRRGAVLLRSHGHGVRVGRHLVDADRRLFVQELKSALAAAASFRPESV